MTDHSRLLQIIAPNLPLDICGEIARRLSEYDRFIYKYICKKLARSNKVYLSDDYYAYWAFSAKNRDLYAHCLAYRFRPPIQFIRSAKNIGAFCDTNEYAVSWRKDYDLEYEHRRFLKRALPDAIYALRDKIIPYLGEEERFIYAYVGRKFRRDNSYHSVYMKHSDFMLRANGDLLRFCVAYRFSPQKLRHTTDELIIRYMRYWRNNRMRIA
jgi:hypothetical protein